MKELIDIQHKLKVHKSQRNNFGKYNYRSCEDILEAVKPLLYEKGLLLTISDKIISLPSIPQMIVVDDNKKPKVKQLVCESIIYCESTATVKCGDEIISVSAQAGIDINKAGMDFAQAFGASSSYARKYALSGLFCLDDTKDADVQVPAKSEVNHYELLLEKLEEDQITVAQVGPFLAERVLFLLSEKKIESADSYYASALKNYDKFFASYMEWKKKV